MRILCLNYETALGSAIHATPVFTALRQLRPDWQIYVACSGVTNSVLRGHPGIYKRYITAHPVKKTWKTALQFASIGLSQKFDTVLINSGNCRPKVAWNARFVRANTRIGVSTSKNFVDVSIETQEGNSVAMNNLLMLKPIIPEINITRFSESFELYFSHLESAKALGFRNKIASGDRLIIGFVTQTSGGQPSEWWDDRFVAAAKQLQYITGCRSVFFGTKQQASKIDQLCGILGDDAVSIAGKTSIEEIGAYCAACDLLITLDTGTMHVGRAVGVPMVVIAPAWQPAHDWLPLNHKHITVLRRWDIGCRHCGKFVCATRECMDEISADDVVAAALILLNQFPPNETLCQERLNRWVTSV